MNDKSKEIIISKAELDTALATETGLGIIVGDNGITLTGDPTRLYPYPDSPLPERADGWGDPRIPEWERTINSGLGADIR